MRSYWVLESLPFFGLAVALLAGGGWLARAAGAGWARGLGWGLAVCGLALAIVGLVFFRDPARHSTAPSGQILSPADGRVQAIEEVVEGKFFQGPARRVAIFMHLGNVHVQRIPAEARLVWTRHIPGQYRPAFLPEAAKVNEQRWYAFEAPAGKYALVQIAGLVARRTVCWLAPDRTYARGERLGMIEFGSEIDTYWPLDVQLTVKPGDLVRAGETVIGEWSR